MPNQICTHPRIQLAPGRSSIRAGIPIGQCSRNCRDMHELNKHVSFGPSSAITNQSYMVGNTLLSGHCEGMWFAGFCLFRPGRSTPPVPNSVLSLTTSKNRFLDWRGVDVSVQFAFDISGSILQRRSISRTDRCFSCGPSKSLMTHFSSFRR